MSAHSRRLIVSAEAQEDIRDILVFTETNWGMAQSLEYERHIMEALDSLSRFPHLGRPRSEYGPLLRSFRVRQHAILYQVLESEIRIARVLHGRRDAGHEFADPTE